MPTKDNALPEYLGSGNPALKNYFPAWVQNMADDATVEGSMLDGVVQGAEAVRSVVLTIRSLYERQEFKSAGPCGDNGFIEDYVAQVHGEPIGCVVLITRNAAGQTQHVVASYRPRSSVLHFWWRSRRYRQCAVLGYGYPEFPVPSVRPIVEHLTIR